jgi:hypothetical protein
MWDKGQPGVGIKAKDLDDLIRTNNTALEAAIDSDHEFVTAGDQSGKHQVIHIIEQSSPGASDPDEGNLTAVDSGTQPELEFTSEDGNAVTLTSDGKLGSSSIDVTANDVVIAGTLDVVGATGIDGAFDVNTDKFTVDTDGNTAISGTLDVTGATELIGVATVADGSKTKTDVAPTAGSSELANAKYVDDSIASLVVPPALTGASGSNGEIAIGSLEVKWGKKAISANTSSTITFTSEGLSAFSNVAFQPYASYQSDSVDMNACGASLLTTTTVQLTNGDSQSRTISWLAIGR